MKLGWFIYIMIGVGIATSGPFEARSDWQKLLTVFTWPGIVAKGVIDGLDKQQAMTLGEGVGK